MRVALLEIGAPAATDQQTVPGKCHAFIVKHVGQTPDCVTRRGADLKMAFAEFDLVALRKITVGTLGATALRQCDPAAELPLQNPCARNMVRVDMGFQRAHQAQLEFAQQRRVPTRLLKDRVDQYRLATAAVAEKVGIGGGLRIEQLPEYQHSTPRFTVPCSLITHHRISAVGWPASPRVPLSAPRPG